MDAACLHSHLAFNRTAYNNFKSGKQSLDTGNDDRTCATYDCGVASILLRTVLLQGRLTHALKN